MEKTIDIFSAITQMRELSKKEKCFSFSFMSYYRDNQSSKGVVVVDKAVLRPASKKEDNQNADFMLNYKDLDSGANRQCYQVTIMFFNGMRVTVN